LDDFGKAHVPNFSLHLYGHQVIFHEIKMSVAQNILVIRERIASACQRVGRQPEEVTLVAVTKTVPVPIIREALAAGVKIIGENRVQEAEEKFAELGSEATWHLVGHLQTNKVKKALSIFSVIQSADSLRLAQEIQRHAETTGQVNEIYMEVNASGEASKFGVEPQLAPKLAQQIAELPNLQLRGLMTIGALTADETRLRNCFRRLRELRDEINAAHFGNVEMQTLSMGMTDDFEVAIEEGSTMVRIGRAIFGERNRR
jgi:hypothetical protein